MKLYIKITIKNKPYFFPMPQKTVVIGRSNECEIKVKDDFASGLHCSLILSSNSLIVKDLDSKNGTFMNGERIDQENMYTGDILSFGSIRISIDQIHTDENLLKQYAPPKNRSESIPYYRTEDITKTHIKLQDFNLIEVQDDDQVPDKKPKQSASLKANNFKKKPSPKLQNSKKTLFGFFKDFLK